MYQLFAFEPRLRQQVLRLQLEVNLTIKKWELLKNLQWNDNNMTTAKNWSWPWCLDPGGIFFHFKI